MNISKKALMSFLMALTSAVSMAQPYYHVMKRDGNKLTEEAATYDAKKYKIRVDMDKPRPKDAIGGKIILESYDCDKSPLQRSFYFTKHGNVYYNNSEGKFHFEKSQLDYPTGTYSKDHCGHFLWGKTIEECIDFESFGFDDNDSETFFYFANPANLPKLKEDLGNEEWTVLSACEWEYVCKYLGEYGWEVDGKPCFLIDTTSGKSLLRAIESKKGGKTMSKEDFEYYEAQGLVCLPASGYLYYKYKVRYSVTTITSRLEGQGNLGDYWSCSPVSGGYYINSTTCPPYFMLFNVSRAYADMFTGGVHDIGMAVRLVVLAD